MSVTECEVPESISMKSDASFEPEYASTTTYFGRVKDFGTSFNALSYRSRSALKNGSYEFLGFTLILPDDFVPGESSWSDLDGTYTWRDAQITPFHIYDNALLLFLGVPSFTYWYRYPRPEMPEIDELKDITEICSPMINGNAVVQLSASDSGDWIQVELDFLDGASSHHVRCSTVIMTADIKHL